MLRIAFRSFGGLLLMALLVYLADFSLWHIRLARGSGLDTVQVSRVSVATLKSNKEEYYFDGTELAQCTRSLLPPPAAEGWGTPCWWLARHPQRTTRY